MSKKIILNKATRIEGNANIQLEIEDGCLKTARFVAPDFRGFETFLKGRRVEFVPGLISRICGLCSASHQIASLKAIENALGITVSHTTSTLRSIILLGERISSHALSYYFLTMPDFACMQGGVIELVEESPVMTGKAFLLRKAGQNIVQILGKRAIHPVSLGIGRFLIQPTPKDMQDIRTIARNVKENISALILQTDKRLFGQKGVAFPEDVQMNFLAYEEDHDMLRVYHNTGDAIEEFIPDEFEEHISEVRSEWSFAKFPYLTRLGFPAGITLVGPLSRSFTEGSFINDPELSRIEVVQRLKERHGLFLEHYDICRLLEIFWASKQIIKLVDEIDLSETTSAVDIESSGQGIGVVEAPRGLLVHNYLINRGCIERIELLVATQFNNAFINLVLKDLAREHLNGDELSKEGEHIISRFVRIFDPCISCATH